MVHMMDRYSVGSENDDYSLSTRNDNCGLSRTRYEGQQIGIFLQPQYDWTIESSILQVRNNYIPSSVPCPYIGLVDQRKIAAFARQKPGVRIPPSPPLIIASEVKIILNNGCVVNY